jgi:SAM-dependent methyltransferase
MNARPDTIARLRADLTAADYTVPHLERLWGPDAAAALARGHRVPARRALDVLADFDAAAVLARVFVLGLTVARDDFARALPQLGMDGATELGLVGASGKPLLDLRPYAFTDSWGPASWWIASDLGELALGRPLPEGHVLGIGGASLTLSSLQVQRSFQLALDLGTGCGIQALHASRHAGRVIATDISPRALELAAFNAELNGIRSIEFRLGDLYEPVAGESFDLIVSNPPFVITPRREGVPIYEYRDGGRVGDAIVAEVIAGAANRLAPGGIAQLLGNWEYRDTTGGLERVGEWLDAAALDGWVIERERQDPALYAQTWIRDGGTRVGAESDRLEEAWLDDFESRGVAAVGFGYLTLRKPATSASPRLRRLEALDGPVAAGLGEQIDATLAAWDWQCALDDDALARAMLQVAPDVTEERHYWPGDEHPAVMNLRQGGGFARSYPLGTALAAVVGACDGELSIAAICAAVSELLEVDYADLLTEVLPSIREFVVVGILRP